MDPQFGNVVSPSILSPELDQIRNGGYNQLCTAHDFLTHMPGHRVCEEFSGLPENAKTTADMGLRVFWYPPVDCDQGNHPTRPQACSLQDKIKDILSSLQVYGKEAVLAQFWAPVQMSNGQILLSVSEQPFGLKGLYNGLCRYRYTCYHYLYKVRDITELGPLGRVFTLGTHERCSNIYEYYTNEEFPLRKYAKFCGILGSHAYPLFGSRDHSGQRQCVGVLEFLSFGTHVYPTNLPSKNFVCGLSHADDCRKVHSKFVSSNIDVLRFLCKAIKPFRNFGIDLWIPCMCGGYGERDDQNGLSKTTQLYGKHAWINWYSRYCLELAELDFHSEILVVKNGKGWVGKACLLNKVCFARDTTQISAFDYPWAPSRRSICNQVPPRSESCYAIPLQLIHPNLPPFILEGFVPRNEIWNIEMDLKTFLSKTAKRLSKHNAYFEFNEAEDFCVELSHSDDDNFVFLDVYRRRVIAKNKNKNKALTDDHMKIIRDNVKKYGGGEQVQVQSHGDGGLGMSASDEDQTDKFDVRNDDEAEITLDIIRRHFGKNITDAANQLGVSRSTLKRRCRDFGIKRWPSHKRVSRVVHVEGSSEFDQESMTSGSRGKDPTKAHQDHINTLTMRATHGDDVVRFPFQMNLGIEELCGGLAKRFKLGNQNFKLKYADEEEWILLSCDEDLHYHMEVVRSSEKTLMNLSVVLIP